MKKNRKWSRHQKDITQFIFDNQLLHDQKFYVYWMELEKWVFINFFNEAYLKGWMLYLSVYFKPEHIFKILKIQIVYKNNSLVQIPVSA